MADKNQTTPLAEWVAAEKRRLDEFAAWWAQGWQVTPSDFPVAMPDGEWDDQYRCWGGG